MARTTRLAALLGIGAVGVALARHLRSTGTGVQAPGGMLIGDATAYDVLMGLAFSGFYDRVATDVAAAIPTGASVLEVGCGPGHLARRLADRGYDVTGLDLDPAMIERARAAATSGSDGAALREARLPEFVVGDVASLPFEDGRFDAVVSTLSMHHWDDATAGIREMARVLKPDGRALVWDLRPGRMPLHAGLPEPSRRFDGTGVRVVAAAPWRWPWRLRLTERVEFTRDVPEGRPAEATPAGPEPQDPSR